jgi:GT2 family glycosyltransferase
MRRSGSSAQQQGDKTQPTKRLAIVAVTYNSADVLVGLLDSLEAGLEGVPAYEVIIVDNNSRDDSVALAHAHAIGAKVISTGRNAGYAAGINAAAATIDPASDLLVLNPDIRLLPGAVLPLLTRLRHPGVGVAVPRMLEEDGSLAYSVRREPSVTTAWAEALLGGKVSARFGMSEIVGPSHVYERGGKIDWATGAAVAVSAEARALVGDWDETFFLYSEEVDFQRRVREAGLSVEFVAGSYAIHFGGEYSERPRLYEILTASRIHYFGRYHGPLHTALFRMGVAAGEAVRAVRSSVHRAGLRAALSPWKQPHESLPPNRPDQPGPSQRST